LIGDRWAKKTVLALIIRADRKAKKISGVLNLMMNKENLMLKKLTTIFVVLITILSMAVVPSAQACSRLVYNGGQYGPITARSMDWYIDPYSKIWVFPEGMRRDGGTGRNSIKWTSKYGSIVTSAYDFFSVDGINEKGLVVNALFLSGSEYSKDRSFIFSSHGEDKETLSVGAWAQYVLDNYKDVDEAYEALVEEPFEIEGIKMGQLERAGKTDLSEIGPVLKFTLQNLDMNLHLSISDPSGNSAIFEYVNGELESYKGSEYNVMTNDPFYDIQLKLNSYWSFVNNDVLKIPGTAMLPGDSSPSSRFIRASYYLDQMNGKAESESSWKETRRNEIAEAFAIIRNVSNPIGLASTPTNLPEFLASASTTHWRVVSSQNEDKKKYNYYFEDAKNPSIFWLEMKKQDLEKGDEVKVLEDLTDIDLSGEVTKKLEEAEPFSWDIPSLGLWGF